jgi:hypothetical protein
MLTPSECQSQVERQDSLTDHPQAFSELSNIVEPTLKLCPSSTKLLEVSLLLSELCGYKINVSVEEAYLLIRDSFGHVSKLWTVGLYPSLQSLEKLQG